MHTVGDHGLRHPDTLLAARSGSPLVISAWVWAKTLSLLTSWRCCQ
ncbi:hypothetical protein ACLK2I_20635 [Escherichia coli]